MTGNFSMNTFSNNAYMKDYYTYKRLKDLNTIRLEYITEDLRNINFELELIRNEIATVTQEYLIDSLNENKIIKDYSTNYIADLNKLLNTFTIKLNECKSLRKNIWNNIDYYNNLLGLETTMIHDYTESIHKPEFKKLFPTYDSYKDCIINM